MDSILYCGSGPAAGCAQLNSPNAMISSRWAANSRYGSKIIAHELGHTFGLRHRRLGGNLMNPLLLPGTDLFAFEGQQMLRSSLLQWDKSEYFMEINPIAVVAEPTLVPEPRSLLLGTVLAMGLLVRKFRFARGSRSRVAVTGKDPAFG
ncbi:reprolysin-like metallopeptidase [Marinobacter lacisalsi]|uniref:Reprolysin-like metallopeptidase n=1 Tax=Marinobacter lacisalsi TaxID=475979 RepID=A0ABV8QL22_9GAMM